MLLQSPSPNPPVQKWADITTQTRQLIGVQGDACTITLIYFFETPSVMELSLGTLLPTSVCSARNKAALGGVVLNPRCTTEVHRIPKLSGDPPQRSSHHRWQTSWAGRVGSKRKGVMLDQNGNSMDTLMIMLIVETSTKQTDIGCSFLLLAKPKYKQNRHPTSQDV